MFGGPGWSDAVAEAMGTHAPGTTRGEDRRCLHWSPSLVEGPNTHNFKFEARQLLIQL